MSKNFDITEAHELALGISKPQIRSMHRKVDALEQENQSIGLTRVRHAIDERLVEIRLLLRDGHTRNLNNFGTKYKSIY